MSDATSEPRKRSGLMFWIVLLLLLAPVLYVASVGPAVGVILLLADSGMPWAEGFANLVAIAYYPLELVADQFEPAQKYLEWYITLFVWEHTFVLPAAPIPVPITPVP